MEITADDRTKELTLNAELGTASFEGTVDTAGQEVAGMYLSIRSKDNRLEGGLRFDPTGHFRMNRLPAGEYYLTMQSIRAADAIERFSLKDGETRSFKLTAADIRKARSQRGFVQVEPHLPNGVAIPGCQISLTSPGVNVPIQSSQNARYSFSTKSGMYQLSVGYPGFKTVTQQVQVKPTQEGRYNRIDHLVDVTLQPQD